MPITCRARLIGEGGGIEVDGNGTAIMTEKQLDQQQRNPGLTKAQVEAELKGQSGAAFKIIWLPGIGP